MQFKYILNVIIFLISISETAAQTLLSKEELSQMHREIRFRFTSRVELTCGLVIIGYFLKAGEEHVTVLQNDERRIYEIPVKDIIKLKFRRKNAVWKGVLPGAVVVGMLGVAYSENNFDVDDDPLLINGMMYFFVTAAALAIGGSSTLIITLPYKKFYIYGDLDKYQSIRHRLLKYEAVDRK